MPGWTPRTGAPLALAGTARHNADASAMDSVSSSRRLLKATARATLVVSEPAGGARSGPLPPFVGGSTPRCQWLDSAYQN